MASLFNRYTISIASVAILGAAAVLPNWLLFTLTIAITHAIAALGVIVLLRTGAATFGQGLFFALGAYVAAIAAKEWQISDYLVIVALASIASAIVAIPISMLLHRFGGIFFAMITLALSMMFYGIVSKSRALGGSDGMSIKAPTLFSFDLGGTHAAYLQFLTIAIVALILFWAIHALWSSGFGMISLATRSNSIRVDYLGWSASSPMAINFVICSVLGGIGGATTAMALGTIEPGMANWTTSGELVFLAVLAGHANVAAVLLASFLIELVRGYANSYFPNWWQLILGAFLFGTIALLPNGLGSLLGRSRRIRSGATND
jgi:branched-chain amino acid transport system permease protein